MAQRFSLTFRMTLFISIMCTLLVGTDIWRSVASRKVQLAEMTTATANLARAMAQHADDTFKEVDTVLGGIVERVEHDGVSPTALERLHQRFISRLGELEQVSGLFLFNSDGDLVINALPGPLNSHNNADREYFAYHRDHTDRGAHLSPPVLSRTSGKWVIPVSRRIDAEDGSFAGVALAAIDVDFFLQFYNHLDIGHEGAVVLAFNNGVMAVRRPYEERFVGAGMLNTMLFREHVAQGTSGTFSTQSSQDGVLRLNSFRSLHNYPLFVAAALSQDEILATWWTDTLWHAGGIGLLVCVLAIFGWRLIRQVNLQGKTEKELAASLETTRAILDTAVNPIITVDSEGRVRSVNRAGQREFGYEPQDIIGLSVRDLVPDSHLQAYQEYSVQFAENGFTDAGSGVELAGMRKDGSVFAAHVSTGAMRGAGERRFVCVITDISEQKKQRQRSGGHPRSHVVGRRHRRAGHLVMEPERRHGAVE
ncbi:PAS domain S-box protein [Pseudomonas sp. NA-150]|uniref:PAS domain S-box protein n=1 Tax=Pseudomonas sp. NA-150 TaxID=3367525 RepID=UPI0037C9E791